MKRNRIVNVASVVGAVLAAAALIGTPAAAHGPGMMGHDQGSGQAPGRMGHDQGSGQAPGMTGHGKMGHGKMGHGKMGHGKMGHGKMGRGMMGHGMTGFSRGKGHAPGMMGRRGKSGRGPGAMGGSSVDKELGIEDVTKILEGRLAWRGNDRLKVGKVEEKDEKTIIADIVTVDDSLVKRLAFDRKTGAHRMVR